MKTHGLDIAIVVGFIAIGGRRDGAERSRSAAAGGHASGSAGAWGHDARNDDACRATRARARHTGADA